MTPAIEKIRELVHAHEREVARLDAELEREIRACLDGTNVPADQEREEKRSVRGVGAVAPGTKGRLVVKALADFGLGRPRLDGRLSLRRRGLPRRPKGIRKPHEVFPQPRTLLLGKRRRSRNRNRLRHLDQRRTRRWEKQHEGHHEHPRKTHFKPLPRGEDSQ